MLSHCVLSSHILVRKERLKELLQKSCFWILKPQKAELCFYLLSPVSRCSDGKSGEREILCDCYGTAAYADVSLALNHQSVTLYWNSLACVMCRDCSVTHVACLWLHIGPRWASLPPQPCCAGSSGRWRLGLCCRRWFTSCWERRESRRLQLLSLRFHSDTDSSSTVTTCQTRFLMDICYYSGCTWSCQWIFL